MNYPTITPTMRAIDRARQGRGSPIGSIPMHPVGASASSMMRGRSAFPAIGLSLNSPCRARLDHQRGRVFLDSTI